MAKLIIMQGLPASGKSTRAAEIMKADGNAVRINKDLIRTMLHFDNFTGKNEGMTRDAARVLALHFLQQGKNVIIDDTNLNPGTLQSWKDLAKGADAKIQHEVMTTSIQDCIERDAAREKKVGRSVIVNMALKAGMYPHKERGFVVCDIDGTIADIKHRLHFVKPPNTHLHTEGAIEGLDFKKDWKSFFEASPSDPVRHDTLGLLANALGTDHEIIFVTARPETYRKQTEEWIQRHVPGYTTIIMRAAHDKRPDTEVKKDIYEQYLKHYHVFYVIDDRPAVIRMWREQGLEVIDVGSGEEF